MEIALCYVIYCVIIFCILCYLLYYSICRNVELCKGVVDTPAVKETVKSDTDKKDFVKPDRERTSEASSGVMGRLATKGLKAYAHSNNLEEIPKFL